MNWELMDIRLSFDVGRSLNLVVQIMAKVIFKQNIEKKTKSKLKQVENPQCMPKHLQQRSKNWATEGSRQKLRGLDQQEPRESST